MATKFYPVNPDNLQAWSVYDTRKDAENSEAPSEYSEILDSATYEARQRDFYMQRPAEEVSAEHYTNMMEVLPPQHQTGISFIFQEAYTYNYHYQYVTDGEKCFKKLVDITDRTTWFNSTNEEAA